MGSSLRLVLPSSPRARFAAPVGRPEGRPAGTAAVRASPGQQQEQLGPQFLVKLYETRYSHDNVAWKFDRNSMFFTMTKIKLILEVPVNLYQVYVLTEFVTEPHVGNCVLCKREK